MLQYIQIHEDDNVAVALQSLRSGQLICINGVELTLKEDVAQGHKFTITPINEKENLIKYGYSIGYATKELEEGVWVHTHNLKTGLGDILSYTYEPEVAMNRIDIIDETQKLYFQGYRRRTGRVGVRNEIWIIPTVGCVNNVAERIVKLASGLKKGSIDEIISFPHPYGCSQMGDDQENTRKILAGLVNHPNAGGVLVLGLGCENSGVKELQEYMGTYDASRVRFLVAQECEDEIAKALELLEEISEEVAKDTRVIIGCDELIIGMKCGGSDGLSGITANPTVGLLSDKIIEQGGSTILTEVPEMFGAETVLMNRCANEDLFQSTVALINDFKEYFRNYNQTIYENPSPGNKAGGISTLEDKSLGCTQKSGSALVQDVLAYGDVVKERGLNLLSSPGNDLVASTALAAAGAHIILFTTGRGTPFSSPVPTVKISSNSHLYEKKKNWIDFNCGIVVEGESLNKLAEALLSYVICVASGEKVKTEEMGYHDMAILKQGVTL